MTTSTDPDGTGPNDDLPYLPPTRPTPSADPSGVEPRPESRLRAPVVPDGAVPDGAVPGLSSPEFSLPTPVVSDTALPTPALPDPTLPTPEVSAPAGVDAVVPDPGVESRVSPVPAVPDAAGFRAPVPAVPAPEVPEQNLGAASSGGTAEQGGPDQRPQVFDAKAMVDSQRRRNPEPKYGSLPTASDGDVEESQRLRAEAQRRRRRNARAGWVTTVVLFGVAVVAGWFVYRAFDDDQLGTGAPSAAGSSDVADDRADVDAGSASNSASEPEPGDENGAAGRGEEVDEARTIIAEPEKTDEPEPAGQVAPAPRIAERPEFRTLDYDVRVYEGVDAAAPYRHFSVTYDTVSDDYFGFLDDSASGESELVSFSDDWRYTVGADGVHRRVRRSKFSMRPESDTPLAALLDETDLLPVSARPFATLVSETPSGEVGVDGTPVTIYRYQLDVDAFRAADPGAHAAWRSLWSTALPDSLDLIVPGTEQVRLSEVTPLEVLQDREPIDVSDFEVTPRVGWTEIVLGVTERGIIDAAAVISLEDDARVVYVASAYGDEPAALTFSEELWVDAP